MDNRIKQYLFDIEQSISDVKSYEITSAQHLIPFVNSDKKDDVSEIVVVGIKDAEKSKEDCSLLYVEISNDFSKSDLLASFKESGIKSKILKTAKIAQVENIDFYLVEAEGFYLEEDDVIKNLNSSKIKPYIKVLGHYPLAINL